MATRIEVASGQSPEGTGTAWVGASVGEARAARVARAEAVTVGSATRMRAAKEFAGTKGLSRGCCLQRKGWSGWGRRRPGPAAHDGYWAHAGLRASQQQVGRSCRRRPRLLCPRGQVDTCHTRPGKWCVQWNRKRKQRAVLRSRSTAWGRRLSQRRRCSHHLRMELVGAAAVAAYAPTLHDAHQSHRHRVVPSSPWHSTAGRRRKRARPMQSAGDGASDSQSPRLDQIVSATRKSPKQTMQA